MSNTITANLGQSLLQPTQGQLTFTRTPNTIFYLQSTKIPEIVLPPSNQPAPFLQLPLPGNQIEFGALQIEFLLDEDMNAYLDIYNWIIGSGKPQNFSQYANLANTAPVHSVGIRPPYSDATMTIFTSKNNPQLQFSFADCIPISLDGVTIDFRENAEVIATATATFKYSYFTFQKISSSP